MKIIEIFLTKYGKLNETNDLQIKKYLLSNIEDDDRIIDISKNAFVSPASISRYIKKIRFSSYKQYLKQKNFVCKNIDNEKNYEKIFEYINSSRKTLIDDTYKNIDKDQLQISCQLISKADIVFIVGLGYSKNQAEAMVMRFNRIGKKTIYVENIQDLPFLEEPKRFKSPICIAISQTGSSTVVNEICNKFQSQSIPIISISSTFNSPLEKMSTNTILIPKIASGVFLETIYSEVTVSLVMDYVYSYVLFENYAQSLDAYNHSVEYINGK